MDTKMLSNQSKIELNARMDNEITAYMLACIMGECYVLLLLNIEVNARMDTGMTPFICVLSNCFLSPECC